MFEQFNDILNVEDVCKALSLGKNTIYGLLKSNDIKSIKVGKKYLIPKTFLIDYVNSFR